MKPPKCRTCEKEEWGHVCKGAPKENLKAQVKAIPVKRAPPRKKGKPAR